MPNSIINPNQIQPELWAAILAKLTIGNPSQADKLNKLLDTLPNEKHNAIAQQILKHNEAADLNAITNPEPDKNNVSRFLLHTAAEALLPQPPIDWIIKPLFSTGTISLVVGNPGSKKTYAMLDLAVCLASGKPWLEFETKQVPTLLIDEESGLRRINRRLGDVMRGHTIDGNIPLQYICLARFNFRQNGAVSSPDLSILEEKIHEAGAKIVIIDALADIMPGADENTVRDIQPIFMGLRQVADNTESAILMIHHSNKVGNYRGSSAILGAVDVLLMVESKSESPNIDFKVVKNRDYKPMNFAATAHFGLDQFSLASSQFVSKDTWGKPHKYVLKYLSSNGASLINDITSHADTCSENSARQALYALADKEIVCRVDNRGPGVKATYDLTEKGKPLANTNM